MMSRSEPSIGFLQLSTLILMSVGLNNHVILIPFILQSAGRDAWVSALVAGGLSFIAIPILIYISKRMHRQHLKEWLTSHYGSAWSWFVTLPLLIGLFASVYATLIDTTYWTSANYLTETPRLIIGLCILTLCYFGAQGGIGPIALCAGIFLPMVVLLGYFVTAANIQYKDYSELFPLFVEGATPMWKGILYAGAGFAEMLYILLLQHHLKEQLKLRQLFMLMLFLIGISVGPIMGSIAVFGAEEASIQRYPAFEQWRMVEISRYLEHVDYLSIFQWLSGTFIRISLGLLVIVDLLRIQKNKAKNASLLLLSFILALLLMLPLGDLRFEDILATYLFPIYLVILVSVLLLLLGSTIWKRKDKRMP